MLQSKMTNLYTEIQKRHIFILFGTWGDLTPCGARSFA